MKILFRIAIFYGVIITLSGCKKTANLSPQASGSLNVVNAVIGGSPLVLSTNYSITSSSGTVNNNASGFMPLVAGQVPVNLGTLAIAATATAAAIPAITYYNNTLTVDNSTNYSLFLAGTSPSAIDNVLIKETYPRTYADSVCGVRFINLAPGSNPISVNITGSANGSEVASLAYKAYSNFTMHPAKKVNTSYAFQIRDATSGTLITSYTLVTPFFHNVTICLRGTTAAPGIILDNDY